MRPFIDHRQKCEKLVAEFDALRASGKTVGLRKSTSNLFRRRIETGKRKLDMRAFDRVLDVNADQMTADVEGMITYEGLVDETLKRGLLPAVVPQLKTITVGGAISGLGIESSSFRFGLVHETVEEMEILTGDGRIIVSSRSVNQCLFFGFPNSYGTLGYLLRAKLRLIPAKRFVHVAHFRFSEPEQYFAGIAQFCSDNSTNYLDGAIFNNREMYATVAQSSDDAPYTSDYTYMRMYYRSIQQKKQDWLTTKAYIWRWDTDWFWCSKHFHVQKPLVRLLATKRALNSRTYQKIMRLSQRVLPDSGATESVIQDVDIPLENAAKFFDFLLNEIGITPIWTCPFRSYEPNVKYDLCPFDRRILYINFGFWDTVPAKQEPGYLNRKIENKALELNGTKALYSSSYYDEATFWTIYDKCRYDELKQAYDPGGTFADLYQKCVKRI